MKKIPEVTFRRELESIIRQSIDSDYVSGILEHETGNGMTIFELIKDDVETTSAWGDEHYYNGSDIKLAIGRVISKHLGL